MSAAKTKAAAPAANGRGGETSSSSSSRTAYRKSDGLSDRKWMARMRLFQMPSLNGAEVAVMGSLIDFARVDSGESFRSVETICKWTRRQEKTVRRALRSLEAKGLIKIRARFEGGKQTSNLYTVAWDRVIGKVIRVDRSVPSRVDRSVQQSLATDSEVKNNQNNNRCSRAPEGALAEIETPKGIAKWIPESEVYEAPDGTWYEYDSNGDLVDIDAEIPF